MSDDQNTESETPPPSYDDFIKDEYPNGYPYHKLCQNQESRLLFFSDWFIFLISNFLNMASVEFLIRRISSFWTPKAYQYPTRGFSRVILALQIESIPLVNFTNYTSSQVRKQIFEILEKELEFDFSRMKCQMENVKNLFIRQKVQKSMQWNMQSFDRGFCLSYLSWNIKVMHNNFILFYNDIRDYSGSTRTAWRKLVTPAFQCIGRVNSLEFYEMHSMNMHECWSWWLGLLCIVSSMLKKESRKPQNSS